MSYSIAYNCCVRIIHYMHIGAYIHDRLLPNMVRAISEEHGIACTSHSDDWVLRLDRSGRVLWIYGYHFSLNPSSSSEIATDKVAAYQVLKDSGLEAVEHYLVRSNASEELEESVVEARIPAQTEGMIVKPLSGSSGKYINFAHDTKQVIELANQRKDLGWTASPFIDIVAEYRVVILNNNVELTYEKTNPRQKSAIKLFNLGCGAIAELIDSSDEYYAQLSGIGRKASTALGLTFAAVDIVLLKDGTMKILEVNSGISFEHFARQGSNNEEKAYAIYEKAIISYLS